MQKIEIKDYTAEELEAMDIPALEEHMRNIYEARTALRNEQLQVGKVLERKELRIKVAQKMRLSQMSEAEREIAVQIVQGAKTASTEKAHSGGAR